MRTEFELKKIYHNYCEEFITNSDGVADWLDRVDRVYTSCGFLWVLMETTLYKYKMIDTQGPTPCLQLIQKS